MKDRELISVIVPIYNVEKYLRKCIDSIIEQTYTNLEIILVDDGSPDNCGKICDEYAKKDKRIIVIHNSNQGVSASRNFGLDEAKGNYITFIDADDFVSNNYIEVLYNMITLKEADLAIIGNDEQFNEKIFKTNKKIKKVINNEETVRRILEEKYITSVCWGKIYKSELLNDIRFDTNLKIGEDFKFMMEVLNKCHNVNIDTTQNLYHYRLNEDSVTQQNGRKEDWIQEIEISKSKIQYIENKYPNIKNKAIQRYIRVNITYFTKRIKENNFRLNEEKKLFCERVKGYKIKYLFLTNANIKYKIKFIFILVFPEMLAKLYNIKKR